MTSSNLGTSDTKFFAISNSYSLRNGKLYVAFDQKPIFLPVKVEVPLRYLNQLRLHYQQESFEQLKLKNGSLLL